jgi:NADPH-dependent 2,4-dienoyl-CoA reductase/sulfur reductase-like enzyme/nitrite reductase/ring-hydroxylating ferredoxin subunit
MSGPVELKGPDLEQGVPEASLAKDGSLLGHAGGEPVLLVKRDQELFAIGATCTHYSGPLAEGLIVGDTVICPHHACFDLRTGEAQAPAWNPVACFQVQRKGEKVFVTGKRTVAPRAALSEKALPTRVVIIGGGAAGHAAAETLRREGYSGSLTLVSADGLLPYDRPNVSKDYLAGNAPEEWMPLRPPEFYEGAKIELRLGARATSIDTAARKVTLASGEALPFDALLLATGADPVRLNVPGGELPHVHYVRSLADSRAIIGRVAATGDGKGARRAVVAGASFIGLEVAASLRARGLEVHVVAPSRPLERVLGPEVGDFVRALHEEHGVVFHIGKVPARIAEAEVALSDGTSLPADLVVAGVGVRPSVELAERAGLATDGGVLVSENLETSAPGIYAAGDIARYPEPQTGKRIRVEHWVVAQRQGQAVARNMLGRRTPFVEAPFFWSQHYDVAINYVGHAERWDRVEIVGSLKERSCVVAYRDGARIAAIVTIGRDRASLQAQVAMARNDDDGLEAILRAG